MLIADKRDRNAGRFKLKSGGELLKFFGVVRVVPDFETMDNELVTVRFAHLLKKNVLIGAMRAAVSIKEIKINEVQFLRVYAGLRPRNADQQQENQ